MEEEIEKDFIRWWLDKATEEFDLFTEQERVLFAYFSCFLDYIELAERGMLPEKWIKVITFAKKLSAEYMGWVDKMGYGDKILKLYEEGVSPEEVGERLRFLNVESFKALIIEEADNRGLSGPLREYILSHFSTPCGAAIEKGEG